MNQPVFITATSGGFASDDDDHSEEVIKRLSGPRSVYKSTTRKTVYIHGELEDAVGFDIPQLLSGDVKDVPCQPCSLYDAEGVNAYLGFLVIQKRKRVIYGLIVSGDDIAKAICSGVDRD